MHRCKWMKVKRRKRVPEAFPSRFILIPKTMCHAIKDRTERTLPSRPWVVIIKPIHHSPEYTSHWFSGPQMLKKTWPSRSRVQRKGGIPSLGVPSLGAWISFSWDLWKKRRPLSSYPRPEMTSSLAWVWGRQWDLFGPRKHHDRHV